MDFLKKAGDVIWDSTIGLLRQYQEKSIELAKIEAVSFYVKSVQVLRKQAVLLVLSLFWLMMLALGILIVPIMLILYAPWTWGVKFALVGVFGLAYLAVPAFMLYRTFSEKRWMKFSMADEWLSHITNHKS